MTVARRRRRLGLHGPDLVGGRREPRRRDAARGGRRRSPGSGARPRTTACRSRRRPRRSSRGTDVDLVVLASPPAVHRDQAVAAAAAGKHVLVEKPMAQDAAECAAMVEACRAAGVRLSVVSQHRFRDTPAAAHRLIADGAIGEVRMIRLTGAEVGWWDLKARGDEWKLDPGAADGVGVLVGARLRPDPLVQRQRARACLRPDHELLRRPARGSARARWPSTRWRRARSSRSG